jgi:hypothetical protein
LYAAIPEASPLHERPEKRVVLVKNFDTDDVAIVDATDPRAMRIQAGSRLRRARISIMRSGGLRSALTEGSGLSARNEEQISCTSSTSRRESF